MKTSIVFIVFVYYCGCNSSVTYQGNKDLTGSWTGKSVEISEASEKAAFSMDNYGFSCLTLNNDSTYFFLMEIMDDVILEKEVFGNPYAKTLLKAGYKNYTTGYFLASSSKILFYDGNRVMSNEYSYYFNEQVLITQFIDKENKKWKICWEK